MKKIIFIIMLLVTTLSFSDYIINGDTTLGEFVDFTLNGNYEFQKVLEDPKVLRSINDCVERAKNKGYTGEQIATVMEVEGGKLGVYLLLELQRNPKAQINFNKEAVKIYDSLFWD